MFEPMKISEIKRTFDEWKRTDKKYLFCSANGRMYCIYNNKLIPIVEAIFLSDAGSTTISLHDISELHCAIENLGFLMQSVKSFKSKDYEWLEAINDIDEIRLMLTAKDILGEKITIDVKSIGYVHNADARLYSELDNIFILINASV